MRKYVLLLLSAIVALSACHEKDTTSPGLSQSVYQVNNYGTTGPGSILLSPYNTANTATGTLMIMDEKGNLLRQKTTDGATFCFRKWTINGQTRYTYIVNDVNAYHLPGISQLTGYVVVADSDLNELKRVHLLPSGNITVNRNEGLDVHDFILLSDDHYITMSYYEEQPVNIPAALNPSAGVKVASPVIQEVNNGAVIWQWNGADFTEFYTTSQEGNKFSDTTGTVQDYMHMNSMIIDPGDNNLICSFRHLDQILKINRQTGAIIWRLGGTNSDFPLTAAQQFLRQHNATLTDNNHTLMLFDNGEATQRPQSRVVEMSLDENSKTVTAFKSFDIPEPFTQYMGSVQKLGDHYFIGGGTGNYVLEINYTNGQKLFELKGSETTYRAYKY